jgi:FeS assembly SUF system protein
MREEEPTPKNRHPDPEANQPADRVTDAETSGAGAGDSAGADAGESQTGSNDANASDQQNPDTMRVFEEDVVEALKHVYDPEIPINVYELGLIYSVYVSDNNDVDVEMTLTTPNCPEAENIPPKARGMIKKMVPGVNQVTINLVWEPPWTMEMMSEDAKLALGLF